MGSIRALYRSLSALVSAKLGTCTYCMGLSLSGALVGWAVFAGVTHVWPQLPFGHLLVLWPIAFTALWALHILTFGGRVVVAQHRGAPEADVVTSTIMTRRRAAAIFASSVGFAVLASAVVPLRALGVPCGQQCCCISTPNNPCTGTANTCCPNMGCHQLTANATNRCGRVPSGGVTNGLCMAKS